MKPMRQIHNLDAAVGNTQILPGTGRGTSEAGGGAGAAWPIAPTSRAIVGCPSTTLRVVPLPRWGRI